MNNVKMKWKFKRSKPPRPAIVAEPAYMTDAQLELLAKRYQANRICYLLDITFAAYLLAPKGWDRIARHMDNGGGCRIEKGELVINHA